jgi:ribonuclease P protein component
MTEPKSAYWLVKRSEFLRAAKGRRYHTALFTIQAVGSERPDAGPRFGLTLTAKAGNSVERNRMKRRLREAIRLSARSKARPATDYVVIGRRDLLVAPFTNIVHELNIGIERIKPASLGPSSSHSKSGRSA